MVFFTTAELLEIGGLPFVTPYEKPTQSEGLKYYRRVAEHTACSVALGEEVRAARRADDGAFRLRTCRDGRALERRCRTLVFATGYYDHPNRLGVPGEDLPHVSHYYTEPHPFYRKEVVVVGGKNSAAIAALELYRAGAARHPGPPWRAPGGLHQVLDPARHREPHQGGRRDRRASRRCLTAIRAG